MVSSREKREKSWCADECCFLERFLLTPLKLSQKQAAADLPLPLSPLSHRGQGGDKLFTVRVRRDNRVPQEAQPACRYWAECFLTAQSLDGRFYAWCGRESRATTEIVIWVQLLSRCTFKGKLKLDFTKHRHKPSTNSRW